MTKSRRSSLALLAAALALAAGLQAAEDFSGALRRMGLAYGGGTPFSIERSVERGKWKPGRRESYWALSAAAGAARLRLNATRNIAESAARERSAEKFQTVENLYKGGAFYPGMVTHTFEVPEHLKPRDLDPAPLGERTLVLYAAEGMAYGAGTDDLARLRGALTFRYCKDSRTLVQIEYFFPKEAFQQEQLVEELVKLGCR